MNTREKLRIGKLEVLRSAAGWYIGRLCIDSDGCQQPYSRESGYYLTKEAAETALINDNYFRA